MLGATLYIMAGTAKNRVRRRLQRLREPRYLVGALVGFSYLYLAFFGRVYLNRLADGSSRPAPEAFLPPLGTAGPALAGLALLAAGAVSWLMPFGSGLLEFTRSETDILFPAPVSRRQLLFYRLIRSQWAVLFGSVIVALTYPVASNAARLRGLIGAWLLLMTCHVFFTGVTLTRTRLSARVRRGRIEAWAPLVVLLGAVGVVATSVVEALSVQPVETVDDAFHVLANVSRTGMTHVVLLPFIAAVQPLFSSSFLTFVRTLVPAIAVYGLLVAWVLHADEAFDRLTGDLVEAQARRPVRAVTAYRRRSVGWTLATEGRPEMIFVWKGAMQMLRMVDPRILTRLIILLGWVTAVALLASRARGFAQVLAVFAGIAAAFTVLVGPQMLRTDLRQDLQHLELLKAWPIRPAAVVRGEMLWPALAITALGWLFGAVAIGLAAAAFAKTGLAWRLSAGLASMIVMPAVVLGQYTIHTAVALVFPAWIPTGQGRPRGVDAMGQRMILIGATWLLLILVLAPGVLAGGGLAFALYPLVGPSSVIPGAMICGAVVAGEVVLATEALGPAYERLDVTSVESTE